MASVITKRCESCLYYVDGICNFCFRTGRLRGCPAGDRCTEYTEGPRKIKTPVKSRQMKLYPEREELYRQGLNDPQIAERLGLSDRTIQMWRVRMGYKANAPAHRIRKESDDG